MEKETARLRTGDYETVTYLSEETLSLYNASRAIQGMPPLTMADYVAIKHNENVNKQAMKTLEEIRLPMITEKINKSYELIENPTSSYFGIRLESFDKETLIKLISVQQKLLNKLQFHSSDKLLTSDYL